MFKLLPSQKRKAQHARTQHAINYALACATVSARLFGEPLTVTDAAYAWADQYLSDTRNGLHTH